MKNIRAIYLINAVLVLSVVAMVVTALRLNGLVPFDVARILAYLIVLLNIAVAVVGILTPHRAAWIAYMIASVAGMALLGAATPITAVALLASLL
jgi:hypothetical protein